MTDSTPLVSTQESMTSVSVSVSSTTSNALSARELEWANNSEALLAQHKATNGSIVRTRFPPEPNGYLHVGHAKSMNMNFSLAFDKLGVAPEHRRCIFRYDDTNPDAESAEYIDSLKRDVAWLGWVPECTTYSSDNFGKLHDFAIQLIQKGLAYCCDMTKAEMELQRETALKRVQAKNSGRDPDLEAPILDNILPGRNRDTSVERNLLIFDKMKRGMYDEGSWTLRLKMDFESSNPNMYDLVAYRIKYTSHPHAGSGWCIYPAYDFTHGICDSLEAIDYSICTLEFETRREPYYWILWALDLYRPKVYEMSRLNLQYTVLSKRRLLKLVNQHFVRGWDDPRMPTISGLRRRGYTKLIINNFCNDLGATRAQNVIEMEKLYTTARTSLAKTSPRAMAALDPIKITVTNWEEHANTQLTFSVLNIPTDPKSGEHSITLSSPMYIDATDFRMQDSPEYYGLAPNKAVGLKYHGGNLICDKVITDKNNGTPIELHCRLDTSPDRPKPKTHISWVPSDGIPCEIRVYNHLFTVTEPTELWEDELNPKSEIVYPKAIIDPSVKELVDSSKVDKWNSNQALQLERVGYFVVDFDTTFDSQTGQGKLVLNRTVSLQEAVVIKKLTKQQEESNAARKLKQAKDLEAKEARMKILPEHFFKECEDYKGLYSKYDDKGIPTHTADGEALSKSAIKKLAKEQAKHIKALAKQNK